MAPRQGKKRVLLVLSYLTVCIVWGSTYLALRVGVRDLPPFLLAGARHLLAGSLLVLVSLLTRQRFPRAPREYRHLAVAGLLLLCVANGLISWAEQWVESGVTALILAVIPLIAAVFGMFRPEGRIGRQGWVGIVTGFSGVAVLVSPTAQMSGRWFLGAGAILTSAFAWAGGQEYSQRHGTSADLLPGVAVQMLAGGLGLFIPALSMGQLKRISFTPAGLAAFAYLVVFGSLLAYTAFGYLLRYLPAAKVSTYGYINPTIAVLLGTAVLGEPLPPRLLLAVPMILGGVVLVQTARTRGTRRTTAGKQAADV